MNHPQWIVKYGFRNRNPKIVRWQDHSEIAKVTSETDAALIAAAPELLNALKECATHDGAMAERSHDHALRRLVAINEIVRAAIEKATA